MQRVTVPAFVLVLFSNIDGHIMLRIMQWAYHATLELFLFQPVN
jgi:hypothetical protein